jgi:integrase
MYVQINPTFPPIPRNAWNKDKLLGQKPPLKLKEVWAIRIRLQLSGHVRDLAMFNLAIDSKLRASDLVRLKVSDVAMGTSINARAVVMQKKTGRPVQFEITDQTRENLSDWISASELDPSGYLFPSRVTPSTHLTTRQYARLVAKWVSSIGLPRYSYGTHSLRRTKPAMIYRRTGNLRAVQLLLGHTKLESTVRYLGVEVDDALEISENTDV